MLIELRVRPGDYRIRSILRAVRANHLVKWGKVHKVPHLTLYGNVDIPAGRWPELRSRVAGICRQHRTLPFLIDDYSTNDGAEGKVIAFRIIASPELESFRDELVRSLCKDFPSEKPWDSESSRPWYHIAVAYKLPDKEFDRVWAYLNDAGTGRTGLTRQPMHVSKFRPYLPLEGLRVTLLTDRGKIDREYDLVQQKFLTRDEALNWHGWCETYRAFRQATGAEQSRPSVLARLSRRSHKSETYFISDLHLDHGNIIRYTARPFCRDVAEMNRVLVNNWNFTVRNGDRVYFLGDLTFGRDRKPASYWWPRLRGEKLFIKGNHDDSSVAGIPYDKFSIWDEREKDTKYFAAVHDPNEMPPDLQGWVMSNHAWVIHGDKHNNNVRNYPFINGERRTINVSAEVINYQPVSLSSLLGLRLTTIKRLDTVRANPIRI